MIYVQVKRRHDPIGVDTVKTFVGGLEAKRARKDVLIAIAHFTREAEEFVIRIELRVVLIDVDRLAELLVEPGVGVNTERVFEIRKGKQCHIRKTM